MRIQDLESGVGDVQYSQASRKEGMEVGLGVI